MAFFRPVIKALLRRGRCGAMASSFALSLFTRNKLRLSFPRAFAIYQAHSPVCHLPLPNHYPIINSITSSTHLHHKMPSNNSSTSGSGSGSTSNSSTGSGSYEVTSSGTNDQGNHYCSRDYGSGASNDNSYHYSNSLWDKESDTNVRDSDGSYYYSNPNGSTYYNSGSGYSNYTPQGK
ncbi:hypothetical protein D6D06_07328 [Aureobasidium pullulans]|nr:hypothetical protein D6D06_07328 [Aureobasidium pullulans]